MTKIIFNFKVDKESHYFCLEIIKKMVEQFKITPEEALARLNRHWESVDFESTDDLRYHEDENFWAYEIFYGNSSNWWLNPPNLVPLPYRSKTHTGSNSDD